MRLRARAWLLVALLAFTANFGVTVSRVAPPREPNAIVHVLKARGEARADLPAVVTRSARTILKARPELRRAADALDAPLFQRPPPSVLFLS